MEVFSHATEEPAKVLKALFSLVPQNYRGGLAVKEEAVRGYFKNPIIIYRAKLTRREEVDEMFSYIAKDIAENDKIRLGKEIDRRVDDSGKLFLRLDKQAAYAGAILVKQDDDSIKMTVRFSGYPARKEKVIETCRILGLIK
jgi:hypothetical protein